MSHVSEMLSSSPHDPGVDRELLAAAITALGDCVQACTTCADACGGARAMRACVRRCSDSADICAATLQVLSRQAEPDSGVVRGILSACIVACMGCAQECGSHDDDHCRLCAERASTCIDACETLLREFATT